MDEFVTLVAQFFQSSDPDSPSNWLLGPAGRTAVEFARRKTMSHPPRRSCRRTCTGASLPFDVRVRARLFLFCAGAPSVGNGMSPLPATNCRSEPVSACPLPSKRYLSPSSTRWRSSPARSTTRPACHRPAASAAIMN